MSFPVINGVEVFQEPPAGYQVDFANPERDWATINSAYAAFGIEFTVAFLLLCQRLYTAIFILHKFEIDDYMIVLAWVFTTIAQALILQCQRVGVLGVHIWEMSLDDAIYETTLIQCTTLIVIPGTVLAKLVLCIFYYRISPAVWYRRAVWITGAMTVVTFSIVWFAVMFACRPVSAAWNLRLSGECIARPPFYILQAVMGGVTDVFLMALAVPTVTGLQMSWKKKVALLAWFSTGFVTLLAAVARLVVLIPSLTSTDTTYGLAQGTLWLIVEANLIIICACLPTLRPFLSKVSPRLLGESKATSGGGSSGADRFKMRYALKTFGSSAPKRRHFDTIDELEHGYEVGPGRRDASLGAGLYGGESRPHWTAEVHGGQAAEAASARHLRDNTAVEGGAAAAHETRAADSDEEAIIQTRTTVVTYDYSPPK